MEQFVITVARQFGSLGRPIAKKTAELLGIDYYDRDVVDETARKLKLSLSTISDAEESAKNSFFRMKFPLGIHTTDIQDQIFYTQQDIILNMADKSSCIIVGRCSDEILMGFKNHIRIFIYAPYEDRYMNCIHTMRLEPSSARKMLEEVDKAREAYYLHYTKHLPQDMNYKDILVNSSVLGVEGTAEFLANFIKKKFK